MRYGIPSKTKTPSSSFYKKMKRTGIKRQLICELNVYPNDIAVGLNGTGMLIINPPWQFDVHAKNIQQYLWPLLKVKDAPVMPQEQTVKVQWLVGE